jgi:hypothetical protein
MKSLILAVSSLFLYARSLWSQVNPAWIHPGQFPGGDSSSAYELETDAGRDGV